MNTDRSDSVFVQHGNSSTLRVSNQKKFYLVKEERQGSRLLRTVIINDYDTRQDAENALTRYNAAKALGSIRTPRKAKASAANGAAGTKESHRRGGRPKGSRNRPKPE